MRLQWKRLSGRNWLHFIGGSISENVLRDNNVISVEIIIDLNKYRTAKILNFRDRGFGGHHMSSMDY